MPHRLRFIIPFLMAWIAASALGCDDDPTYATTHTNDDGTNDGTNNASNNASNNGTNNGTNDGGDGVEMLGRYCEGDDDCDGGLCDEVMCTIPCDGADFDAASCPDGAICHEGRCHLRCDDVAECPTDSDPGPPTTGGYRCSAPNDDFAGACSSRAERCRYTCYLNPSDPGG